MATDEELTELKRQLTNVIFALQERAKPHPVGGAELTMAMRKAQEALFYIGLFEDQK